MRVTEPIVVPKDISVPRHFLGPKDIPVPRHFLVPEGILAPMRIPPGRGDGTEILPLGFGLCQATQCITVVTGQGLGAQPGGWSGKRAPAVPEVLPRLWAG